MNAEFHARFAALDRTYRYVFCRGEPDPRRERYGHRIDRPLDVAKMQMAARMLEGTHDFLAYTEELDPGVENTVRTLFRARVSARESQVAFTVRGTAFLRGMMRRMAGGLLEVGAGRRHPEDIARLLDPQTRDRLQWPVVLPARGLTLLAVRYGPHPKDRRNGFEE